MKNQFKDLVYDVFASHFHPDQWEWMQANFEAQLEALTNWIPIQNQQPAKGDRIIGYDKYYGRVGEVVCDPWKTGDLKHLIFIDSDDCRITHWQPFPVFLEEKNGD